MADTGLQRILSIPIEEGPEKLAQAKLEIELFLYFLPMGLGGEEDNNNFNAI
jgi:hypothetical protein